MAGICLLGSGRMGQIHAANVAAHPALDLIVTVNPNLESAQQIAESYGGHALESAEDAMALSGVDAVVIASPSTVHLEHIELACRAGMPILCEKPLELDLGRVDLCLAELAANPVPLLLGFNRRFDPSVRALRDAVVAGEIGDPNMLLLTSRDVAPPPQDYVKRSGGYFCDSTIHDIDLACWILGEAPEKVYTAASCLIDETIGAIGDVDTAMTTLTMPSGRLCHINNSRKAVYGFDQRIEAFGSGGMIQTENQHDTYVKRTNGSATGARPLLKHFFLERYADSFRLMLDEFAGVVLDGNLPSVTAQDGKTALALALACDQSRREGVPVTI